MPFDFSSANEDLVLSVDPVAASAGVYTGGTFAAFDFSNANEDLIVSVDGGDAQTVTLTGNCNTAADCAGLISIEGATVTARDGNLVIASETVGSGSSISITESGSGPNALANFGAPTAGTFVGIGFIPYDFSAATAATYEGTTYTAHDFTESNEDLIVIVDGGSAQNVTLSGDCSTPEMCAQQLAGSIVGVGVTVNEGNIRLTSYSTGLQSSVEIVQSDNGSHAFALFGDAVTTTGTVSSAEDLVVIVDGGSPQTIVLSANCSSALICMEHIV
eukprot:SAG31_NODE_7508_length_1669_cov_1.414650_1_plen_273_part_10